MLSSSSSLPVVILLLACVCVALANVVVVGRTISKSGIYSEEAPQVRHGVDFWFDWLQTNKSGLIEATDGANHAVSMVTMNDASDPENVDLMYRLMSQPEGSTFIRKQKQAAPVDAAFGPWTAQSTQPAIAATQAFNVPFIFSGGSVPAFYNATAYPHAVGMLIQFGKRCAPCMNLFAKELRLKTVAMIASTDPFQQTAKNIMIAQLTAFNVTVIYNTTVDVAETRFSQVIEQIVAAKPELLVLAMESRTCIPFVHQLRARTIGSWQPSAIYVTNSATVVAAYNALDWEAQKIFAGNQWSSLRQYSDPFFGSTEEMVRQYRQAFNTTPTFIDAASVAAGFVLTDALERVPANFTNTELIAALRSTNLNETFFGPVRFLPTGEIDQIGICEQLLPSKNAAGYEMRTVSPPSLAIDTVVFPGYAQTPPGYYKWHEYSSVATIIFMIFACLISLAALGTCLVIAANSNNRVRISQLGYWFIVAMLIGIVLTACTVFSLVGKPSDDSCKAQIWLSNLGASAIIVVLFAKSLGSLHMYNAMNRRDLYDMEKHQNQLALCAGVLFNVEILYLILWTAIAPPKVGVISDKQHEGTFYLDCSHSGSRLGWIIAAIVWKALLLIASAILAFVTRAINEEYIYGKRVALLVYSTLFISVAFIAAVSSSGGFYDIQYIFKNLFALLFALSAYLNLFGPLVFDYIRATYSSRSSTGGNNSDSLRHSNTNGGGAVVNKSKSHTPATSVQQNSDFDNNE